MYKNYRFKIDMSHIKWKNIGSIKKLNAIWKKYWKRVQKIIGLQ